MTESGVREIQLTAKQLVFVFMAAIVFSVAVFLLGVAVGRGGASDVPPTSDRAASGPAGVPPATKAAPAELSYHDTLQTPPAGVKSQPSSPPVAPPPATSPEAPPTIAAETPAAGKAQPPSTTDPPPPPPAAATPPAADRPAATTPPAATGRPWFVQVGSFRERPLAEQFVQDLKRQGYAAQLVVVPGNLPNKVRVGPFAQESDARAAAKRLVKHKPVVIRP
jgi:cell division protein FtsN